MSPYVLFTVFVVSLVVISASSDFCNEKKSERLKNFDATRKNLISTTATHCAINYFDVESINQLTLNLIPNAKSIRVLDLTGNRISMLHSDTFNQFSELENLKLGDNFLVEIRSHYFNGLRELSILDLSSNLIRNVDENSFLELGSLLWINLANNCIINFAINLPIVVLDSLNLSHNLIANFPHFKNIGSIDSLDLSHNTNGVLNFTVDAKFSPTEREKIMKFTTQITRTIKSLSVADNELSDLTQLESFINVDELSLASNPIQYNANSFQRFTELKKLNLSCTNLTSLETLNDANLRQLETLSIEGNPLKADFDLLGKFPNLQHIHLPQNSCYEFESYREIRRNFKHLTHITILYDNPNCKCAKKNKKLFSLYHIKFSTDRFHLCSRGQTLREGHHNGFIYFFALIVFQAFAQLKV